MCYYCRHLTPTLLDTSYTLNKLNILVRLTVGSAYTEHNISLPGISIDCYPNHLDDTIYILGVSGEWCPFKCVL